MVGECERVQTCMFHMEQDKRSRAIIPAMAGKSNQVGLSERCTTVKFKKCEVRKCFLAVRWGWI